MGTYSQRGPGAHEALTDDRTGIATFRGSKVFEAQSFDMDFQREFIDLTSRPRMCGEYFVIPGTTAPHNFDQLIKSAVAKLADKPIQTAIDELGGASGEEGVRLLLKGAEEDPFIHIYSADKDDYVKISYSEANRVALNGSDDNDALDILNDEKKKINEIHKAFTELGQKAIAKMKTPREKKEKAEAYSASLKPGTKFKASKKTEIEIQTMVIGLTNDLNNLNSRSTDDEIRIVGENIKKADLELHHVYFLKTAKKDRYHYDILLLRPFQTYTMHSAIMAKGGSELGSTYHGHHDFQLSDNVAVKTHFGNYTFYSKAVVKRPRNYTIIPDCFAQGYISGEGHTFFLPPAVGDDAGDLGKAIQEGTLGSSDCRQSLIAWKIPRGDGEKLADAIDITGRFAGQQRDYEQGDGPHFEGADALASLEYIEELDQNRTDEAYLHQVQHVNTVCFRGAQYTNGTFTHHGKGHWGTPYAGVLPVRDGAIMYMDPSKEPKKGDQIV